MRNPAFLILLLTTAVPAFAEDNLTHVETVRARFQTGLHDDDAPAVYGKPVRSGLLEGNERFRLQDNDNRLAVSGDLSAYLQTNDNSYQLVPNELYADLAPTGASPSMWDGAKFCMVRALPSTPWTG